MVFFSNEAGLGSAPIAAAAAQTKEPVRQGLVSMTGTFIDTIVICTMTGLSIVLTGAWQVEGLEGVQVTTYAFQHGLPDSWTDFCICINDLSGILCIYYNLGWDYYSERCLEYLTNGHKKTTYIPLALHSGSIYRTVHDSKCCMDDRRYLQRTDGDSEYDRIVRIKWSDRKRNKSVLCSRKA